MAILLLAGCGDGEGDSAEDPLAAELAEAYRMDVSEIDVSYDFWPSERRVVGSATLRFTMRPGQERPLFHFNPLRRSRQPESATFTALELDGERLDPYDEDDLRRLTPVRGAEPGFEVQRSITDDAEHTLEVSWSIPKPILPSPDRRLFANFDDTEGPDGETETMWPTVSSPESQARHQFDLRVHSRRSYVALASGGVRRGPKGPGVQVWNADTRIPVASHTAFFALVPADRVTTRRFDAAGVPVRIISTRPAGATDRAAEQTRDVISQLETNLGPFPIPRMEILLAEWGSGMEYYGATRTGLGSLRHELVHMYFGASAVNRTWRDTWIDEAAVVWLLARRSLEPVGDGFRSEIAAGRPSTAPGFDESAYGAGARILEAVARRIGGDAEMVAFLRGLHERREFEPFTTEDLIDDLLSEYPELDRDQLEGWMYGD